jgi:cytochrome c551/c552
MFKFAEKAKAYAALVGAVLTALSGVTGVVPDPAKPYVAFALAVVTAIATFQIPNAPATEKLSDDDLSALLND